MTESRPQAAQPGEPPSDSTVPKVVVSRISLYLRELQRLEASGQHTISSGQLGTLLGFSDAQELIRAMRDILGTNHSWGVAMVGVGNLGQALLGYRGFGRQNFSIAAAFDADPAKVGQTIQGLTIQHIDELAATVKDRGIRLGMIVVPAPRAQEAADRLVAAGVEGIVNFAPVTLVLPAHVQNVGVDLAIELEQLSFAVTNKLAKTAGEQPPA
jgi:redox-sensing transcriptional repressor